MSGVAVDRPDREPRHRVSEQWDTPVFDETVERLGTSGTSEGGAA